MPDQSKQGASPKLAISVIIPTWNRKELLRKALDSFRAQTLDSDRFEVIVVDNDSSDGTESMVCEFRDKALFHLTYHRMPKNEGPVLSRNVGAKLAAASILAFTDSDCQATAGWLETAVRTFAEDPEIGFISGPAISTPGQRVRFFSIGGAEYSGENPTYPTANAIYSVKAFEAVGGFDPTAFLFDAGSTPIEFSDTDMGWRVREHGFRNRFIEELVVHHEVRDLTPLAWLRHYTRLMTIPELVRRHPGFGKMILWWGPFCFQENLLFYLAIFGMAAAILNAWFLLLAIPFFGRIAWLLLSRGFSIVRLPLVAVQICFLALRQGVMCASLIYGSIRSRTLVL